MVSDSATASDSVSIRNQVLPPGASQTYLMIPPNMASGNEPASRGWACDVGKKQNPESGASQQQHRQISRYLEAVPICSRSLIGSGVVPVWGARPAAGRRAGAARILSAAGTSVHSRHNAMS